MAPEDEKHWDEGVVVYTQCIVCDQFMDEPHCKSAGCPYCAECYKEKMEEIENPDPYPEGG